LKGLLLILAIFSCNIIFATHYRAGEISYKHISGFTYEITVVTYTKASSIDADSDTINVKWGDGTSSTVYRDDPIVINLSDLKINTFRKRHTYSGPSTYTISIEDQNRNGGIVNIPESDQIPFYVETILTISPQEFGVNNSPILTYPPVDLGTIDQIYIHNTGAYDPDGDSLGYELITPKGFNGLDIPGYNLPDQFPAQNNNKITLDPISGDIIWDSPQTIGQFNLAIRITEYRNGIIIGSMMRDMQITIVSSFNEPPIIDEIEDACYIAEDLISQRVLAKDEIGGDELYLFASGGPFEVEFWPANFEQNNFNNQNAEATFSWQTNCSHIRKSHYSVNFKALDNHSRPLADIHTWLINITGPPPKNLVTQAKGKNIELKWDSLYNCSSNKAFIGYSIWRKEGTSQSIDTKCPVNLRDYGFENIATADTNFFLDTTANYGISYCYVLQSIFREGSTAFPYNEVLSLPSLPSCGNLDIDLPIPIHVDVIKTDQTNGNIFIEWIKPNTQDFDTIAYTGPYQFDLYRSENKEFSQAQLIFSSTSQYFKNIKDTSFTDSLLNTKYKQYYYRIGFYSQEKFMDYSPMASSVFLDAIGTDQKVILNWQYDTPWHEDSFNIYKKHIDDSIYILIANTDSNSFIDTNVVNQKNYNYYVQTYGNYAVSSIDSLINHSQEISVIPIDSVPPPAPILKVSNACQNQAEDIWQEHLFANELTWYNPEGKKDIIGYQIFQKNISSDSLVLSKTINDPNILNLTYDSLFNSIAGCYAILAFDSNQTNYSQLSNVVCIDNCPRYELPNVFSPNNDGINDYYKPFPGLRFIESINFKVYNRWGDLVFQTQEKNINWDGRSINNSNELAQGVYFYTCVLYEYSVDGIKENPTQLSGYINIFR